jgi:hypothetical protein
VEFANDVFMRVWLVGQHEPKTFVLAIEAYIQFEDYYHKWRMGRATRSEATMIGGDGNTVTLQFADLVVRQMTTRDEYEKDPAAAFQTLEELSADYLKNTRRGST